MVKNNSNKIEISYELSLLMEKVVKNQLYELAERISVDYDLPLEDIKELIPKIFETKIENQINSEYIDISNIKYKNELNKYNLVNLKEICKNKKLKITGSKQILIDRIWDSIDKKDEDIDNSVEIFKSYKSKKLRTSSSKNKQTKYKNNSKNYHFVEDDDNE